jgi:glycosyltransferase involved in cell wall biosynthesis
VKTKPGRRRRVAISGLSLFSQEVAEQLERQYPQWKACVLQTNSRLEVAAALFNLLRSEVWYSIGSPFTDRWVHLCARLLRKPHVIHWVGSDIEVCKNTASLRKHLNAREIKHLTEIGWTAQELRELGMESEIAPLPLRHGASGVKPLPQRFTILLYLPRLRPDFYGRREYETLLEEFAHEELRVLVVGGGELHAPAGVQVEHLGWRDDLAEIYERSTLMIRLTPRDGLSLMVLEALSFGRYVMWSKPFPYTTHLRTLDDMRNGLRALLARHREGTLHAQYAAAEMIARQYSPERTVTKIMQTLEAAR